MASEHYLTLKMKKSSYNRLMKQEEYEEEEEEDEEEEEALSLCDLPTIVDLHNPPKKESPKSTEFPETLEEFNFCSSGRDTLFNESELCAADDVFFQGRILPMRHSVSSIKCNINQIKSNSSAESIDHCSSGGFTSGSSRSSSISSRYSSSSINSTSKIRVMNQFQFSHPSPKPQVKQLLSNTKNGNTNLSNSNSKSQLWSLFRVGLVTTPEIAIQDLKFRNNSNRSSRNGNNGEKKKKKKKKQKTFFNKNVVLFGGCKCSASTIGSTVDSRIAVLKRNQSAKEENIHQRAGKQALSRHRTFEWLKQLSLETATTHEL